MLQFVTDILQKRFGDLSQDLGDAFLEFKKRDLARKQLAIIIIINVGKEKKKLY